MDNFTLMCFRAIEIQKLCQNKIGDGVYYFDGGHFNDEFVLAHEHTEGEGKSFHIEVLKNTKLWLAGKKWDELTGIYIWKPGADDLLDRIMNSKKKIIEIEGTKYCQAENFGITIYRQPDYYEIVLRNSPFEFAYNWINWKEKTLIGCLLDVCMFLLCYKVWDKDKREWITKLWDRNKREFHEIKKKYEIKDE